MGFDISEDMLLLSGRGFHSAPKSIHFWGMMYINGFFLSAL